MMDLDLIRDAALKLPEVTQEPHFNKTAFKLYKKIFATLDEQNHMLSVKLSVAQQDVFTVSDKAAIYPVPNKWGQQGWTLINLKLVRPDMLVDALKTAYCEVAPKKLAVLVSFDEE